MTVWVRSAAVRGRTPCWDVVSNLRNGKVIQFNEATRLKRMPDRDFTHDVDTFIRRRTTLRGYEPTPRVNRPGGKAMCTQIVHLRFGGSFSSPRTTGRRRAQVPRHSRYIALPIWPPQKHASSMSAAVGSMPRRSWIQRDPSENTDSLRGERIAFVDGGGGGKGGGGGGGGEGWGGFGGLALALALANCCSTTTVRWARRWCNHPTRLATKLIAGGGGGGGGGGDGGGADAAATATAAGGGGCCRSPLARPA